MAADKTIPISFRVTPRFKALLEAAAAQDNRSQTNMLETLLFAHCRERGLTYPVPETAQTTGDKQ